MLDVSESNRLVGLDLARGLAVFGMFWVHLNPHVDVLPFLFEVPDGRSSILFATLAGVSIALMSGGTTPLCGLALIRVRHRIALRGVVVFVIGVGLLLLRTPIAVILPSYGLLFVLVLPFLRCRRRTVLLYAIGTALLGPVALITLMRWLLPEGLTEFALRYDPLSILTGTGLIDMVMTGAFPVFTWLPYILAGMAVGRSDVKRLRRGVLAGAGIVLATAGYLGSSIVLEVLSLPATLVASDAIGTTPVPAWSSQLYAYPHSGTTFEIIAGFGVALVVIDISLVIAKNVPRLARPLVAVGAMPLTVYVAQALALLLPIFASDGTTAVYVCPVFVFVTSALAMAWLHVHRRGPLESVIHRLTVSRDAAGAGRQSVCETKGSSARPNRSTRRSRGT
ncbi:MAG: hypothetical protein JWR01_2177 [Subtercola sp.]|nr:hypothetical protein [Subtercola sp.]